MSSEIVGIFIINSFSVFPEYKKIADTKDTNLDNHLKKVFVTSTTNQVNN